ncbi:FxSxx-COOH system tetratricopeptide repeat protein [Streptomyces sp. NPDC048210]|uniref:FxSxx-COOH system tetratricopeptide repeat protein n=1 Tax=Streptomyces sp. NPDC048210 TaxID=3156657 RepID=UPI0034226370
MIDRAPSMHLWEDTMADFVSVLAHAGCFRDVRVRELDASAPGPLPQRTGDVGQYAGPGDHVLLLATDCLGLAWRDGRMAALLRQWSRTTALGVVQLLPQRLWARTSASIVDFDWSSPRPGSPAYLLRRRPLSFSPEAAAATGAVPLLALDPASLKAWSELVVSADDSWHRGFGLLVGEQPTASGATRTRDTAAATAATRDTPQAGRDAALRFLRTAEPDSVRLAALLAVAPVVTVRLLRVMQHRLLPETGDFSAAEAFLSGLLMPAPSENPTVDGQRAYTFRPGTVQVLMRELGRSDIPRALTIVDEFLPPDAWTDRTGSAATFLPGRTEVAQAPRVVPEPRRDTGAEPELRVTDERLPSRNKNFTGRGKLLNHLRDTLTSTGKDLCILQGGGGVGKTQTALEYAHRHRSDYDFVWWVEAGDAAKARQSLEQLGTALGMTPDPDGAVPVEAVLDRLHNGRTRSGWLLVMNNAESPERLEPVRPRGQGHVIITSRSFSWTTSQMPCLRVAPFQREESMALLHRLVADLSDNDAEALAEKAGDLPLALVQFGYSIAGFGLDVAAYLAEFDAICTMLLRERPLPDYPLPVVASWQVTLDSLREEAQDSVGLLHLLCFLGTGPIPQDLLFAGVGHEIPLGPGQVLGSAVELLQALYQLGDAGLISVDKATRSIEVHRVLQLVVRHTFMKKHEHRRASEAVLCLLAAAVPDDPTAPDSRLTMAEISRRLNVADALASERDDVGDLVVAAVRHHHTHGDRNLAARIAELAKQRWHTESELRGQQLEAMRRCLEQASPGQ